MDVQLTQIDLNVIVLLTGVAWLLLVAVVVVLVIGMTRHKPEEPVSELARVVREQNGAMENLAMRMIDLTETAQSQALAFSEGELKRLALANDRAAIERVEDIVRGRAREAAAMHAAPAGPPIHPDTAPDARVEFNDSPDL